MRWSIRRGPDIDRLWARGDLTGLIDATGHRRIAADRDGRPIDLSATSRREAVRALSDFYGPDVTAALAGAVEDADANVRRSAINGLAAQGSPDAHDALIAVLASSRVIADPDAREQALEVVVTEPLPGQTAEFATALAEHSDRPLDAETRLDFDALLSSDPAPEPAQTVLRGVLPVVAKADADGDVVRRLRRIVAWCAPIKVHGLLQGLVRDDVPDGVLAVAGHTGDNELVGPLAIQAERPSARSRRYAVEALGALRDTSATVTLLRATRDEHPDVRDAALAALDGLGAAGVSVAVTALAQASLEARSETEGELVGEQQRWTEQTLAEVLAKSSKRTLADGEERSG